MKKYVTAIVFCIFCCYPSFAQKIYYSNLSGRFAITDVQNGCTEDSVLCNSYTFINFPPNMRINSFDDIAFHPNGTLYIVGASEDITDPFLPTPAVICSLNFQTCEMSFVTYIPHLVNGASLVCSNDGVLYTAGYGLGAYNTLTNQYTYLGELPVAAGVLSAGDLTFRKGKLYLACTNNNIAEINIANPMLSHIVIDGSNFPGDILGLDRKSVV